VHLLQANKQFILISQDDNKDKLAFDLHRESTFKYYKYWIILIINKFKLSEEKLCINLIYVKLIKYFELLESLLLY